MEIYWRRAGWLMALMQERDRPVASRHSNLWTAFQADAFHLGSSRTAKQGSCNYGFSNTRGGQSLRFCVGNNGGSKTAFLLSSSPYAQNKPRCPHGRWDAGLQARMCNMTAQLCVPLLRLEKTSQVALCSGQTLLEVHSRGECNESWR